MNDLSTYSEILDMAFKFIGVIVALYIAPIKKDIKKMSSEIEGLQGSVNKLNLNMALVFEKHDIKEQQIKELQTDMRTVREKLHTIGNDLNRVQLNELRIDKLEGKE